MIIFDGYARAEIKEARLKERVAELTAAGTKIKIAAILFTEDSGSQLYTRLKSEAAQRVGIGYEVYSFSLANDPKSVITKIQELNIEATVTGIIVQKPSKGRWLTSHQIDVPTDTDNLVWQTWWHDLVSQISQAKDVDGLHPDTLAAFEAGTWEADGKVLPATARAVLEILAIAAQQIMQVPLKEVDFDGAMKVFLQGKKTIVIGKSDIVGKPVFYALKANKCNVEMIGTAELNFRIEQNLFLHDADVIISSTGRPYLVNESLIKSNVTLIDVGEPMPDIDQNSVEDKTLFLTPVPGGVGPMTVICLLENAVELVNHTRR